MVEESHIKITEKLYFKPAKHPVSYCFGIKKQIKTKKF